MSSIISDLARTNLDYVVATQLLSQWTHLFVLDLVALWFFFPHYISLAFNYSSRYMVITSHHVTTHLYVSLTSLYMSWCCIKLGSLGLWTASFLLHFCKTTLVTPTQSAMRQSPMHWPCGNCRHLSVISNVVTYRWMVIWRDVISR